MATKEVFENLRKLQDILVRKYELEAQISEAPKTLGNQEEFLAKLKKEYITKNADYEVLKEKIGGIKVELDAAIKLREDGEKSMDNISTHREYEALEKQINEAKIKEEDLRKELQHEEKSLQALDESLKSDEAMIKSQEDSINNSKKSIDEKINSFNKELNDLKKKEDTITPNLDQETLFKFERIIQRNSEGIVAVKNGVCTGCHMMLPAQFANIVREEENIHFCPYCSRILFYEEVAEGEDENYFNVSEDIDLGDLDDFEGFDEEGEEEERTDTLYETENRLNGEDSYSESDDDNDSDDDRNDE